MSPYLFVVAIEILAISIRSNTSIKGITIGDNETKLLAYADDMTALLSDITSAKELLDGLNTFQKYSGLKMNVSKTKAMWIGIMKNSARNYFKSLRNYVTSLGAYLYKREHALRNWRRRHFRL